VTQRRIYAFNGDADGLCALQQLRLAEPGPATLVTGAKRDIELLRNVDASTGDTVVVLDVSLDVNRRHVEALLARGVFVAYFDHHYAGVIPSAAHFEPHIDASRDVCTSILVDRHLAGRHRSWAIVAAFGDGLDAVGRRMAHEAGFDAAAIAMLARLGTLLNYNAYGHDAVDLHFDPAFVAAEMLPFGDPLAFTRDSRLFARLDAAFEDDMIKARAVRPTSERPGAAIVILPAEKWARRTIGILANELVSARPTSAVAMLVPRTDGGYVVSVRVPPGHPVGADDFCRGFASGGGRAQAAGINHLAQEDVARFEAGFLRQFQLV